MVGPSNREIADFEDADWAGYVDSGVWELEQWMARNSRLMQHFQLDHEDPTED